MLIKILLVVYAVIGFALAVGCCYMLNNDSDYVSAEAVEAYEAMSIGKRILYFISRFLFWLPLYLLILAKKLFITPEY